MKKLAVCIGIDQYPDGHELSGCVADANNWAQCLGRLGFVPQLVANGAATLRGFLDAIRSVIQRAEAGDVVTITYSGHGIKAPSVNGQVYGEGLVPIDFNSEGFIVDDDIGPIFDSARPNVAINFILDSCFSGAAKRFLGFAAPQQQLPPNTRVRRMIATPEMIQVHQAAHASRHGTRALTNTNLLREAIFTASGESQVSVENGAGGYFTQCAMQVLQGGQAQLSNASFVSQVAALVNNLPPDFVDNGGIPQHPQLRCPADLQNALLFGSIAGSIPATAPQNDPAQSQVNNGPGPAVTQTGACQLPSNPTTADLINYFQCISQVTRGFKVPYGGK